MRTAATYRAILTIELSVIERRGPEHSDIGLTLRDRNMELQIVHLQVVWNDDLQYLQSGSDAEVVMNEDGTVRYVIANHHAYDPSCVATP